MRWDHSSRSPKRRFCMSSHQGAQPCIVLELGSLRTKALAVLWRKEFASFYFPQKASHLRDCGTPAQLQMLLQYSHFPFSLTFQTLQAVNLALPQHPTGLCYEVKVRTKIYTCVYVAFLGLGILEVEDSSSSNAHSVKLSRPQ